MYNAARLLSSWELYEIFVRQAFSLAMQLQFFSNDDGSLIFATYLERMPEHYMRDVWVGLLIIGNMTKNRQFLKSANALQAAHSCEMVRVRRLLSSWVLRKIEQKRAL